LAVDGYQLEISHFSAILTAALGFADGPPFAYPCLPVAYLSRWGLRVATDRERRKLTKRAVDWVRAHPSGKDQVFWDAELARFGLRQKTPARDGLPSKLSWLIQYRNRENISKRFTYGDANAMTPEEARKVAQKLLVRIDDPNEKYDPAAERLIARQAETFRDLVESYLSSDSWILKAPSTQAVERGLIDRHLIPLLGNRSVRDISNRDMEGVLRDIRTGKTAKGPIPSGKLRGYIRVRGGAGTARRTIELASVIFAFAVHQGIIAKNPCSGLKRGSNGTRDTIIEDEAAYKALFTAIRSLEAEQKITIPAGNALRLIALTGARRGEITNLRRRHLDLARQRIILQPEEHKAGRRTSKNKVISLPAVAVAILASMLDPDSAPDDLVIRSAKRGAPIALKKPWTRVRARAGLPQTLTIHGLRHSIGSHLAMAGASGPEIQAALGHATLATSVRYIHFAEARKNALAERAAAVAVAGLQGAAEKTGTDA
jgi:integrase